jgi:hypothetical protein
MVAPSSADRCADPADDSADYCYVERAFGGIWNRNQIRHVDQVETPEDLADCYTSMLRFTADLKVYAATNLREDRHGRPRPRVAGYAGPALALFVPLDLDGSDPAVALVDLRRLLPALENWGIPLESVRLYFSGAKGFHIELPASLFGGFAPATDIAERLKALVLRLTDSTGITTLDHSIYERLRLWRMANSKHGKSGLLKVPLTAAEVFKLDINNIRDLATQPRHREWLPDDEWLPRPELAALWQETTSRDRHHTGQATRPETGERVAEGGRNAHLTSRGGGMRRIGMDQDELEAALLVANEKQCDPPLPDAEVRVIARSLMRYPPAAEAVGWGGQLYDAESRATLERQLAQERDEQERLRAEIEVLKDARSRDAYIKQLEREILDLQTTLNGVKTVVGNSNLQASSRTVLGVAFLMQQRTANAGDAAGQRTPIETSLAEIASYAGVSVNTVGRHTSELAEMGLLGKRADHTLHETRDGNQYWENRLYLTLPLGVDGLLQQAAAVKAASVPTRRHGGERPRCTEHPDAQVEGRQIVRCARCKKVLVDTAPAWAEEPHQDGAVRDREHQDGGAGGAPADEPDITGFDDLRIRVLALARARDYAPLTIAQRVAGPGRAAWVGWLHGATDGRVITAEAMLGTIQRRRSAA